ncbi:ee5b2090-1124-4a65-b200-b39d0fb10b33 [Thermothielavioides terrestris]|uniref:Uncharacterized protein n=2 Tax=Thermothielavioides terrestris TaxID=2587410 RepID=G2R543_THETT|nr:uncharacterized protein THITE_153184 [Thermothielavioides terrestris NRRL 8126]AEO65320.1 hypothetical protein THITE_153184 [Thermothielavioides terrestris NRRL 8126]SPQ19427.1 ee5b2090-1124-4a65-b200-b39d0fb10b33 [Thermothielavioides terrestris]
MGNLCSTERERDAFAQPGRRLGAAPAARTSASVPTSAEQGPRKVGGPPQTLGGGAGSGAGQAAAAPGAAAAAADDAQRRAATAAEDRFQKSKPKKGKLQAQLDRQRAMTDAQVLRQAGETERRQRELDQSRSVLNHD